MTCPLFVELCAGTAAVSLRLHGGPDARPPVSRMGSKRGYAQAILNACGLRSGQGAGHYLWCEPDPGVRLLLEAYRDPELAREAAAIIRGWADEEPRALWERLRAEGPPRGPEPREVARWLRYQSWKMPGQDALSVPNAIGKGDWSPAPPDAPARYIESATGLPATIADDARRVDPREVARWAFYQANRTPHADVWKPVPKAAEACGVQANLSACGCAGRIESATGLPATITDDARRVDPREVAREVLAVRWSFSSSKKWNGYGGPGTNADSAVSGWTTESRDACMNAESTARLLLERHPGALDATIHDDARRVDPREVARWTTWKAWETHDAWSGPGARVRKGNEGSCGALTLPGLRARIESATGLPATIADDARPIEPADLPPGTVVYIDPPYVDTTGYGHDLPREEVVTMARRWADAGALVCISEQEPIPALMAEGWHSLDITSTRKGQKRTFSKQQAEWLTMSRPPAWRPAVQVGLFG